MSSRVVGLRFLLRFFSGYLLFIGFYRATACSREAKSIFGGLKNPRWHSLLKVGTQLILIKKDVSYKIKEGATSNFAHLRVFGSIMGVRGSNQVNIIFYSNASIKCPLSAKSRRTVFPRPFCPSVRLSVERVNCDKTKETCVHNLIPHKRLLILVF